MDGNKVFFFMLFLNGNKKMNHTSLLWPTHKDISNFPMEKSWVCTLRADEANQEVELRHANRDDMFKAIREAIADREDYAAQWEGEKDAYIYEQEAERAALRWAEERYDHMGGYDCPIEAGYETPF